MSSRTVPTPPASACQRNGITATPRIGSAITARQPSECSTSPPTSGPRQLIAAAVPASRPRASPRTDPAYRALSAATPSVGTAAAPAPWKSRDTSSTSKVGASAAAIAPTVIKVMPKTSGRRTPTRSLTRP